MLIQLQENCRVVYMAYYYLPLGTRSSFESTIKMSWSEKNEHNFSIDIYVYTSIYNLLTVTTPSKVTFIL